MMADDLVGHHHSSIADVKKMTAREIVNWWKRLGAFHTRQAEKAERDRIRAERAAR
jgi:hypothetical protein